MLNAPHGSGLIPQIVTVEARNSVAREPGQHREGLKRAAARGGWSQGPALEELRFPLYTRHDQGRSSDLIQMYMHTSARCFEANERKRRVRI